MTVNDSLSEVRAILATTPQRWTALTAEIPDDLLRRAPAAGEWSALECLRHVRDVEEAVFQVRLGAFRAGTALVPYDPDRDGSAPGRETPAELAADFAQRRAASLTLLDEVTADELALSVNHPEYGRMVRLGELLSYWAAHDLMHTVQAERALIQWFISDTGPWRVMLADHDLAGIHETTL
jgi:uncharacterized damage-inducible protein DinB